MTRDEPQRAELLRSEEELVVDAEPYTAGSATARKRVETERVEERFTRDIEHVDGLERVPAGEADSGEVETLPDGSVSIPVLEERLIVTKEIVVRERVIVRKRTVTETERVEADLRRERVDVDGGEDLLPSNT